MKRFITAMIMAAVTVLVTVTYAGKNSAVTESEKLINDKKYDAAIELLRGEITKKDLDVHRFYIRAHVLAGKYDEIMKFYEEKVSNNPGDEFYMFCLGYVDYFSGVITGDIKKIRKALAIYEQVINQSPDFYYCRYSIGMIYLYNLEISDYNKALECFILIKNAYESGELNDQSLYENVISQIDIIDQITVKSNAPILELDTGGHMTLINKVISMKNGRYIITCSNDKSIRIWDTVTGMETVKILGQIGSGLEGKIYAIAMTPDERYLVVGGFLSGVSNRDRCAIRVYDIETGILVHVVKAHKDVINDLYVSTDNRYLVSASSDKTVKVWDVSNNFKLIHTFEGHSDYVYAVRIFKNNNDYYIVSAGCDKRVILWSLAEKEIFREYIHKNKLRTLAICSRYIAASGPDDKTILIFDSDFNHIKNIEYDTGATGLAFSPDEKLLLAGNGNMSKNCNIYDTTKDFEKITSFTRHNNLAMAVSFIDNDKAVTCGGDNNNIYIWNAYTGEVIREITGEGRCTWSVGINGDEIAWGNTLDPKDYNNRGPVEKSINLVNFEIKKTDASVKFKTVSTIYREYSLITASGGNYELMDASLVINKNNKEIIRITRGYTDGYRHSAYGFTNDGVIISGGSNGFLTAYNTDGEKIASFIGHSGEIWSIAIDGDTLVSGSDDQTIKVWNLKELKEGKKEIYPVVSIFVSKDNEWVIWNEQGFYTASPKGDRFVGWHVNHGPENAAEYYSAKQFRRYLHRPDIIKRTLELMSGEKAVAEFIKKEPGLEKITVAELVKRAPVDVKIDSVNVQKDGYADINIRLGKNNTTSPERITIYINGGQALTEKQRVLKNAKPGDLLTYHVRLTDAKNHIKVTVENQWAENSAHTTVDVPQGTKIASTKDSTLYVVAIGISRYPNLSDTQQLKSPPIDAKSIAARFKKLEGVMYKKVDVIVLTDENGKPVTSDMVERAILEQSRKAGPLDTTIIFLAGHGVTDSTGSYHFVTADTNLKNAYGTQSGIDDTTSFSWKRLHRVLDTTMGRRVVIVDTCQAGEVFSDTKTDISKLVKDVHDVNAIVYSGTSRQDAGIETKEGGVFTLSIVSGISGNAKYQGNVLPFLNLKEYVDRDVPARNEKIMKRLIERAIKVEGADGKNADAGNTQKPVAVVPDGMEGFVVYGK